ncbi:hypothetical protein K5L04_09420 [Flavobacterium psychrophilum]|uniref:hypothetical protein n=1 Tax=Flavobacterium psychrophilum TaxID=96345 RepID=UPI001C8F318D|nr:hypothetical protein [Flavobacterium psychrophilum]QZK99916.1 hypothetical protein K5L04_09420 [Flavobacterium psychrophilum]
MPRKTTSLIAAKQINDVLEKMIHLPYDKPDFMKKYVVEATKQKSPSYKTEIAKMLKDNDCFSENGKHIFLNKIPSIDVIKASIEKALKTRKGTEDKTPKLKYTIENALKNSEENIFQEKKLIPKDKFLDSMTALEIIDYLRKKRGILIVNNEFYIPAP